MAMDDTPGFAIEEPTVARNQPLTVGELTRRLKDLISVSFQRVSVVGEISNLVKARSGHIYFTLKDDQAQLSAILWRSRAEKLKFELTDGLEVVAKGGLDVYPARGSYQLIADSIQPQGVGALELAFRQLQEKLAAEGLFDPDRKRELPFLPRRIALVTSPTGAAVRDMLQVLTRRWPGLSVCVVPVAVQGNQAARQIAEGLRIAAEIPDVDVVITGRGGGSLEELWPFNEEVVARAIAASPLPIVSAVGHETDVSISDLVADRRALTPTEAAEFVIPVKAELMGALEQVRQQLSQALRNRLALARHELALLEQTRYFANPETLLHDAARELDELDARLAHHMAVRLEQAKGKLGGLSGTLDALSPLKVLARGYSLSTLKTKETETVIHSIREIQPDDEMTTRLVDGEIRSRVLEVSELG